MQQPQLVGIHRRKTLPSRLSVGERLAAGPIGDKYFTVAALSAAVGIGFLGIHLWLMRAGTVPFEATYGQLRHLHAAIQLFLFFGLSILGFSLQSAPRFLGLRSPVPLWIKLLPLCLLVVSLLCRLAGAAPLFSACLSASAFLLVFLYLSLAMRTATTRSLPFLYVMPALLAFAFESFQDSTQPLHALHLFWMAVGGPLFAFSQLFIGNLLGGERLSPKRAPVFLTLYLLSVVGSIACLYFPNLWLERLVSLNMGALITFFVWATRLFRVPGSEHSHLALAFRCGFFWAWIGAFGLLFDPTQADGWLHLWATGWATGILIAMSLHITGFLSGTHPTARQVYPLVLVWQLVPIGRGLGNLVEFPSAGHIAVSVGAAGVLLTWLVLLLRAEAKIHLRQFYVSEAEPMIQEG